VTTQYGSRLFPQHAELLAASAVPPEIARARGYVSVDTKARLEALGYTVQQRRVPGLLVPLHSADGRCVGFQYRPDAPRTTETGRPVKYETPGGQANRLDVPPGVGPKLGDPNVELWITEGARKADAAAHRGLACVSLTGVWNWRSTNPSGGKVALPDWQDVALNGRRVVLAFDSDSRSNPSVGKALDALAGYLSSKGAYVVVCQLPAAADGKTGLDDYLAAGHGLDDLAALIVEHAEIARPSGKETAATALVDLVRRRYRLGLSTEDEPFAVPHTGPRVVRPLRGGKGSLRAALAAAYYADGGRVAPQQALAEALQTVEGLAQELDPEPLHLRVAEHDGALHLDLGDPTGRAVVLSATGWRVVEQPPVLFRRTALTGALPTPQRDGELGELWTMLNVTPADRPLVLAWLIAALLPDVPHPVLALRGEQGSGKSSASRILAALLDPGPAQTRKPPRDVDSWVTAAAGSWVVALDNVSTVAEWWSDALCRAVTGDGDVRRRLYSDADLTVFSFRRVVLLNGVDLGAVRDDLAERLLTVELARIGERGRRLDAELAVQWQQAHPRILGALLDLSVQVLATLPTLRLSALPRMADFARVLAAVDAVLGTDALVAYLGQAGEQAADAVDADPVLAAVTRTVTAAWEGPAAELLDLIAPNAEPSRQPKGWPKDSRTLTAMLRRRGPSLRRLGWVVEDLGRGGRACVVRFRLVPPAGSVDAGDSHSLQATSPALQATAGDVACIAARPWPAETATEALDAGDAGDRDVPSLLEGLREGQGERPTGRPTTPMRDVAKTSPASPASPAGAADLGPCRRGCGRTARVYGEHADPLCAACRTERRASLVKPGQFTHPGCELWPPSRMLSRAELVR